MPALTSAGHALELRSLRGPAWTDILRIPRKGSVPAYGVGLHSPICSEVEVLSLPCPCLRRGHRSLLGSPPPASWCLSAFCCPPVAPNPCLHPRRLLPLPLFGQSSVSRCSAERRGDACPRPGRRCAASCWIVVSSIAPCRRLIPLGRSFLAGFINEVLAKGNVVGNASLRQWKAIPYPVRLSHGTINSLLMGCARRGQEPLPAV